MSTRHRADAWPPRETTINLVRLTELAALVDEQFRMADNPEIAAWLARLLVIRGCGYLERTVMETCRAYTEQMSFGWYGISP